MTPAPGLAVERLPTPLGELLILSDGAGRLRLVDWADGAARIARLLARQTDLAGASPVAARGRTAAAAALAAYFAGDVGAIDGLPVAAAGTPFQRRVWAALREIPCGRTVSYGELARRVGRPAALRAVGFANGANPASIVVPCHRVVGAGGGLTGYGGGIARKRWLLAHERASRVQGWSAPSDIILAARAGTGLMVEEGELNST